MFSEYDASEVKFNPPVPPPAKYPKKKFIHEGILNDELESYIKKIVPDKEINLGEEIQLEDVIE